MSRGFARVVLATCLLALGPTVQAATEILVVDAPVLSAEPLERVEEAWDETGDCAPARPREGASIGALLHWDLRSGCQRTVTQRRVIDGWRVRYEWDARVHERTMAERPGATVPVRLVLD